MTSSSTKSGQISEEVTALSVEELIAEILSNARKKQFAKAEELREKLIQLSPMSLKEIISTAETIEKEKSAGIDSAHIKTWDNLYQLLNEEEQNTLFYSMKKIMLPPKKTILVHQSFNNKLFFIDDGQVVVFRQKEGKNVAITKLEKGSLVGEYTFCSIALCSASVATLTETTLYCLDRSTTEIWEENQPALLNKLLEFCKAKGHIDDIIQMQEQEEAAYPRYLLEGHVTANLLAKNGEKTANYFRGNLADISQSGVCFLFKCSKKATARALLTRTLLLSITIDQKKEPVTFSISGTIIKVLFHLYNDYSLHVQFKKLLPKELIKKIIS